MAVKKNWDPATSSSAMKNITTSGINSTAASEVKSTGFDPSMIPSTFPTELPTQLPSLIPSPSPSTSMVPSFSPSDLPSLQPSVIPSVQPSNLPSTIPSIEPTKQPGLEHAELPMPTSKANDDATTSTSRAKTSTRMDIAPLLFSNTTTFSDILGGVLVNTTISVPKNLHLVMLGDSLTRFQYLSFVYFIRYGKWIDPDMLPNPTWEHTYESWNIFSNLTSAMLSPYEQCDCYRFLKKSIQKSEYDLVIENRYYLDESKNSSVTYLQKFGPTNSFKSMWNVTDVHNRHTLITKGEDVNYVYKSKNWTEHIHNFVSKLTPKPNIFVFNEGIWVTDRAHGYYTNQANQKRIIKAISDAGMTSVYKTTTKSKGQTGREVDEYETQFCELADYCLDFSWTSKIPDDLYHDNFHFKEPVYKLMNLQMLELLSFV